MTHLDIARHKGAEVLTSKWKYFFFPWCYGQSKYTPARNLSAFIYKMM